ncbi:MAG: FecR domain-containing protein [Proteiniphilum sp.]|uniref:FecR family protein n=1 Tax=Proteiniphilum sp. TaxID=1926877 RepID=UPI002B1EAD12|nr:FecR domain-containing protein [Proteiniphilum sp.]MEA5127561.1 FecR domain-containing protein [Proteiniphilum sp.]
MNNEIPEIVVRVLQGNQTEEDMRIFLQWYRSSQENKDIFFQLKHIHDLRKGGLKPDGIEVEASWDRLWVKLKKQSITDLALPEAVRNRRYSGILKFTVAAAIAAVLVVAGIYIFYKGEDQIEWIEVSTGVGSRPQTIMLSDGSIVRLNSSSMLRYPEKFNSNNREVYLDGEAYFNVKEDKAHTFVVHTDKQLINVLGTEFNVLAYSSDPYTITTLVTGKVKLDTYDDENNLKIEIVMQPNQQAYFDKEFQQTTLSEVNSQDVISWMKGIYSFRDAPLEEITRRFEKIYGVTIIIPDEMNRQEKYTGKFFAHQDIREIVNVLNFKGQFRLQFHADTILLGKR